ncbi:MAG: universal stress protein [Bryobacteraceae bacterium]|nr:universal stress protein [Bryobacterales bacterium]NUM99874.1 universal stress protein [Bryobacteraceae bacterium]
MAAFEKILVPVDLSHRSIGAVRYACSLAEDFGSDLVFLHVIRSGWPLEAPAKEIRDHILGFMKLTPARFLVREGLPAATIIDTAATEKADLILMPTRGVNTISRLLGRSITTQVLRTAPCTVWSGVDDLSIFSRRPIRNVLCGLSLGPRTSKVLECAAGLAAKFHATLSLVHATKALRGAPGYPCDDWRFQIRKLAKDGIQAAQEEVGTNAEVWVESGTPVRAVPALAEILRSDLLVIGKSPDFRLLPDLRSISYDIVNRAPCPVASV